MCSAPSLPARPSPSAQEVICWASIRLNSAAQIDGFVVGDTIKLTGVTDGLSAGIVNGNTLQIERTAHPAVELKLDPTVNYTGNNYAVRHNGAVTEAPCFLRDPYPYGAGPR